MGVRENKVERFLADCFKQRGGLTRKWISPGVDGVTDQVCILNGFIYFVEVKTADGVLSDAQVREHGRLREAGASVHTVYGARGVSEFMREVVDRDQQKRTDQEYEKYPSADGRPSEIPEGDWSGCP